MPPVCRATLVLIALGTLVGAPTSARADDPADVALLGGRIVTLDAQQRMAAAIAVRGNRIVAVGSDAEIRPLIGDKTRVIQLDGKMVLPGLFETHCHPVGVAQAELDQPYTELYSIAEIQNWIRHQADETPVGQWIQVPRNEITRLDERRHPTRDELDAACTTHPVIFTSARKHVFNSAGWQRLGIDDDAEEVAGGSLTRSDDGRPWMLFGGSALLSKAMPRPTYSEEQLRASLDTVLRNYNRLGITSIFDRANDAAGYLRYRELHDADQLPVRVTVTFRNNSMRTAEQVEQYVERLGIRPGDGNAWVKPGPLKITLDGGIHWGNTRLTEPYGQRRIDFYKLADPQYRGDLNFTPQQLQAVFAAAHQLGWQMSVHVTGDDGILEVLAALEATQDTVPVAGRRFTLIHAYFPSPEIAARAARLGIGVDTQSYLYYRDADAIDQVYGRAWSERFMGLGTWARAGVPVAINSDHMIGLDPDHAMNSFNPFLMLWIAVARKSDSGQVYGATEGLSRLDALRGLTTWGAWLSFDEQRLGSLEVGKLADLVVIDRDYLTCNEDDIRQIQALLTMVDGKVVFER